MQNEEEFDYVTTVREKKREKKKREREKAVKIYEKKERRKKNIGYTDTQTYRQIDRQINR